jgi:hypothetical protein
VQSGVRNEDGGMQIREGSLQGRCPSCPRDPAQRLYRHGSYERYAQCDGQELIEVPRYYCRRCGRTFSVLPDSKLPYVAATTSQIQIHFDAFASGVDPPPPPATERLQSCVRRGWKRLAARVGALCSLFGQVIGKIQPNTAELWGQLRLSDCLEGILQFLAARFKTSLFADYRCLK